jgi:hypothetical protein
MLKGQPLGPETIRLNVSPSVNSGVPNFEYRDPDPDPLVPPSLPEPDPDEPGPDLLPQIDPAFLY